MNKRITAARRKRTVPAAKHDDSVDAQCLVPPNRPGRHLATKRSVDPQLSLANRIKAALKAKKPKRTTVELAILPQRRVWESIDGRKTFICDLTDRHLVNLMFLLKRRALAEHLIALDQLYNAVRTVSKRVVLGMGYTMGPKVAIPPNEEAAIGAAIENDNPYAAFAEASTAEVTKVNFTQNTTWEDHTDVMFHCCRLEALRRGMTDVIELVMTDKSRLED